MTTPAAISTNLVIGNVLGHLGSWADWDHVTNIRRVSRHVVHFDIFGIPSFARHDDRGLLENMGAQKDGRRSIIYAAYEVAAVEARADYDRYGAE